MKCSVCKTKDATHVCGKCELVVYCGEECATQDWVQIHANEHSNDERENKADEIISGLWIGGLEAVSDPDFMSTIDAVVSAVPPKRFRRLAKKRFLGDRPVFRVPIEDAENAPIEKYFEPAAAFIEIHLKEGHNVLVHCVAGHSRSVSLVLYYLMTKHKRKYTLDEAFALVYKKRPTIAVNDGFWAKLKQVKA